MVTLIINNMLLFDICCKFPLPVNKIFWLAEHMGFLFYC